MYKTNFGSTEVQNYDSSTPTSPQGPQQQGKGSAERPESAHTKIQNETTIPHSSTSPTPPSKPPVHLPQHHLPHTARDAQPIAITHLSMSHVDRRRRAARRWPSAAAAAGMSVGGRRLRGGGCAAAAPARQRGSMRLDGGMRDDGVRAGVRGLHQVPAGIAYLSCFRQV